MSRGFTLLEVVIALVVLEVGVVGALGVLTLASRTLGRAERLERAAAAVEGVLDSLSFDSAAASGRRVHADGLLIWTVGSAGEVGVVAIAAAGDTLASVDSVLPPGVGAP